MIRRRLLWVLMIGMLVLWATDALAAEATSVTSQATAPSKEEIAAPCARGSEPL